MLNSSNAIDKILFLTENKTQFDQVRKTKSLPLFYPLVIEFFDDLSKSLIHDKAAKKFSDIIAYAFWIRKTNIFKEQQRFLSKCKIGRGIAFHVAPSNVPINFAVSMTSSLLAGNISIIRVSSKKFMQVDIVVNTINKLLSNEKFRLLNEYIYIIRYEHDREINDYLSSICDLRIVWGGDNTIRELKKSAVPVRCVEMNFADRDSICIIDSDAYLSCEPKKIASAFYVDTYFTDQNACSSPRLVVWTGKNKEKAKDQFYRFLQEHLDSVSYKMNTIMSVDKLNAFCELSLAHPELKINRIFNNNTLVRVGIDKLTADLFSFKCTCGYFFEYDTDDLVSLCTVLGKTCQTVAYLGIEPEYIKNIVVENGVRGVDRIVPIGKTMELEFFWDGYDMIDTMSRNIDVTVK